MNDKSVEVEYNYVKIREKAIANSFISKDGNNFVLNNFGIGFGNYSKTTPASIGNVEAYIEELVRVWKKLRVERKED